MTVTVTPRRRLTVAPGRARRRWHVMLRLLLAGRGGEAEHAAPAAAPEGGAHRDGPLALAGQPMPWPQCRHGPARGPHVAATVTVPAQRWGSLHATVWRLRRPASTRRWQLCGGLSAASAARLGFNLRWGSNKNSILVLFFR